MALPLLLGGKAEAHVTRHIPRGQSPSEGCQLDEIGNLLIRQLAIRVIAVGGDSGFNNFSNTWRCGLRAG